MQCNTAQYIYIYTCTVAFSGSSATGDPSNHLSSVNLHRMATMQVQCFGSKNTLYRPCVDCGRRTGNLCELECQAKDRMPLEFWNDGQCTPHCTECERRYDYCHFCRGVAWVTPPPWGAKLEESSDSESDTEVDKAVKSAQDLEILQLISKVHEEHARSQTLW